jgi:uncharacterized membrane protein YgaE (UPF0421/DUF939 family)
MNANRNHEIEAGKPKRRDPDKRAEYFNRTVKTVIGALIGTALTSLFGVVIFAFVIKAFTTSEEMSFHLLNSAITLVGTALGAVLGYFLGRNSNDKPEQGP